MKTYFEEYEEIKDLATTFPAGTGYANKSVEVVPNAGVELSALQCAIIADHGNLCFGYRPGGTGAHGGRIIIVYTD